MGKNSQAHEYIDKAIDLSKSSGAKSRTAVLLGVKGMAYFQNEEFELVHGCFMEWARLAEESGEQTELMNACLNLSRLYSADGFSQRNMEVADKYA